MPQQVVQIVRNGLVVQAVSRAKLPYAKGVVVGCFRYDVVLNDFQLHSIAEDTRPCGSNPLPCQFPVIGIKVRTDDVEHEFIFLS